TSRSRSRSQSSGAARRPRRFGFGAGRREGSVEVAPQRLRGLAGDDRLVAVFGVLAAELDRRTALDRVLHLGRELEADEVHGRGLPLLGPLEILVRDPGHPPDAFDLDVEVVLDPGETDQRLAPLLDVRKLDHERRLEVAAVRDERVVRRELLLDGLGLEDPLDAQHLLDLVLHREAVLEIERRVRAERHLTVLLVREHPLADLVANLVVLLEAVEIADLQSFHVVTSTLLKRRAPRPERCLTANKVPGAELPKRCQAPFSRSRCQAPASRPARAAAYIPYAFRSSSSGPVAVADSASAAICSAAIGQSLMKWSALALST